DAPPPARRSRDAPATFSPCFFSKSALSNSAEVRMSEFTGCSAITHALFNGVMDAMALMDSTKVDSCKESERRRLRRRRHFFRAKSQTRRRI
ncbi:MAG: hypothetical protein Q8N70_05555, partial [Deltaproteobacteria bacterium]|nr:hypothetical protein [Deltaproteobacteria bacterium]